MKQQNKKRVLIAMSGGVDSSVAACLLKEQGYEVIGVTMQVWDYSNSCSLEEGAGTCCSNIDTEDARSVADFLNIPFYVLNYESDFKRKVIDNFVDSYLEGNTPIPCVDCNTFFKFNALFDKMRELNCDYLATGHYAKIKEQDSQNFFIQKSFDDWKDQTYFLFTLPKSILSKILFPVGTWSKPELRKYAAEKGLPVAQKKDSTGICFIDSKKGYANFIEKERPAVKGETGLFRSYPTGEVLGKHQGIHHYTYGQRKGLGVFHKKPLYVIQVDPNKKEVWLGEEEHLYSQNLVVKELNLFQPLTMGKDYTVKIRFHHKGDRAKAVEKLKDGSIHLHFYSPQRAITPGQAAVIYDGNLLIGGGWITSHLPLDTFYHPEQTPLQTPQHPDCAK